MHEDETMAMRVVVNREQQYSIWPADRALPGGWRDAGVGGERQACLDYIDLVWTDMRGRSLRERAGFSPDVSAPG